MIVGRAIGWLLIIAALAALAYDASGLTRGEGFTVHAAGELWYELSPDTLNMLQAGIQRNVWPYLWDPVILNLLLLPAWVILGVLGILLVLLFRRRNDYRRRWR